VDVQPVTPGWWEKWLEKGQHAGHRRLRHREIAEPAGAKPRARVRKASGGLPPTTVGIQQARSRRPVLPGTNPRGGLLRARHQYVRTTARNQSMRPVTATMRRKVAAASMPSDR